MVQSCALREHIAGAAHGDDAARLLRIVLDGGADARDVDVDRAVERFEPLVLHHVHDGVARQHAPGVLREREQHGELIAGQFAGRAVEPGLPRADVDLQPAEAQHLDVAAALVRRRRIARSRASNSRGSNGFGR